MLTTRSADKLHAMTNDEDERGRRGQAIGEQVGKVSDDKVPVAQLAREASISRQTVYAAIRGEAKPAIYDELEAALKRISEDRQEHPEDYAHSGDEGIAEVELHGVFGVERVIVRSRPGDLEAEVRATLQALREGLGGTQS